jgi:hypothetical protein
MRRVIVSCRADADAGGGDTDADHQRDGRLAFGTVDMGKRSRTFFEQR